MRAFFGEKIPKPRLNFDFRQTDPLRPLALEIGAGQGLHAIAFAAAHPFHDLIAVEKTHSRFSRLEGRVQRHPQLRNLFALHADVVAFVWHYLPPECLDQIFLLYPNPYPKTKQANLRWHNRPFLTYLLTKLKPGGRFTLASNLEWYVAEATAQSTRHPLLLINHTCLPGSSPPRTHFEKKYLARGESCWNLVFVKVDACKKSSTPVV